MADNTTLNAGAGGDVIATDDIAGVKYQVVKIGHGLADAAPVHTSATNPLPVTSKTDIGRNARVFMLDAYTAAPATEALASVVQWYGNAAVAATTTPAVIPAGKTLRLTSWSLTTKSLAAAGSAVVRLRVNTAGLVALASPLAWSMEAGSPAAVAGVMTAHSGVFPDGFDIPAAAGIGFSFAGYNATGVLTLMGVTRFVVHGYEF